MDNLNKSTSLFGTPPNRPDKLLEQYYDRLQEWALLLTRGDVGKAQDIVHELCLHLTLSSPDLSNVRNLDGYLYTCLRHIYLSDIARCAREAVQSIGLGDFDSIQIVFRPQASGDSIQQQNDLRRICSYVIWRKSQAKSAAYFILRFLHGYYRSEIATIAGVSLSTIDPKLNKVRSEVHLHLAHPGKLQFANRDLPPNPVMHWTPISSLALFKELRDSILAARQGECLTEEDLLYHYRIPIAEPVSCSLLSHIVSCERCLSLIDAHFQRPTLIDREPLDGFGSSSDPSCREPRKGRGVTRESMLRSVRRHGSEIFEHRPKTLSIAVDGRTLAFHEVQSERNKLSARIERPESGSFVEVFSEQGLRLALLSLFELPPDGPHEQSQRISLSEGRWLELCLTFDGLGLNCEVLYFDPVLAMSEQDDDAAESMLLHLARPKKASLGFWTGDASLLAFLLRWVRTFGLRPELAWSLVVVCVIGGVSYHVFHRSQPVPSLNAAEILERSIQVEMADMQGQTEHQVFRFEEAATDGTVLKQGQIDLWQDGDGRRHIRRLYDNSHLLLAAEWKERNGERGEYRKPRPSAPLHAEDAELTGDELWKQEISPRAFENLSRKNVQVLTTKEGFELTTSQPELPLAKSIWAKLMLDQDFRPTGEIIRLRDGNGIREIRFIQANYERHPSTQVSDTIFDPREQIPHAKSTRDPAPFVPTSDKLLLAQLHLAVLYQLSSLNADTSDPIEVDRTVDGRIRVTGTLATDDRKRSIESLLNLLDNHQILQLDLFSPSDFLKTTRLPRALTRSATVYVVGQGGPAADPEIRAYFQAQGLTQKPLDAAVNGYSGDALAHALRALQNAAALKRLTTSFTPSDLRSIDLISKQHWTEMVAKHAVALNLELRVLHEQLSLLSPSPSEDSSLDSGFPAIEGSAQFAHAVDDLLASTKDLEQRVSHLFASGPTKDLETSDIKRMIAATNRAIPLRGAMEVTSLAVQLNSPEKTAGIGPRQP
jgi:DNA-directed RNA polymerase specialized sigma24 family protein